MAEAERAERTPAPEPAAPTAAPLTPAPAPSAFVALQGLAATVGNAAFGRAVASGAVTPSGPVLARDDKPGQPKVDPATVGNPFDHPKVKVEVERLAINELRGLTGDLAVQGYATYLDAISTVAKELEAKKKEEEEKREAYISIVLSIGLMALGPSLAAVAPKITGPVLHDKVRAGVAEKAGDLVKAAGVSDADAVKWMKNDVYEKLSNDTITNLAGKFDAEKAKGAVDGLAGKVKDKAGKMAASMDMYTNGALYLEQLKNAADASSKELLTSIRGMSSYDELLGVYNTFRGSSREAYLAQVRVQAQNFMEQIAPVLADKEKLKSGHSAGASGYTFLRVDAYGKKRICFADYDSSQGGYHFRRWVTPDMEKMAEAQNPRDVSGSVFLTGIPDPMREEGKERVVKMDAWGRYRLAVVKTVDDGVFTKDIVTVFVRWVPDDEAASMEARGTNTQIGGLNIVDPATVKGLKAPADA
jgi:hypothetical protein